jgi:D-methionine transport system permease protein
MMSLVSDAFFQTLLMVFGSMIVGILGGVPLGVLLYLIGPRGLNHRPWVYGITSFLVNIIRSIPFIILMILFIPVTRFLTGSSIGTEAALVPLSMASITLLSRIVEEAMNRLPFALKDLGMVLRASRFQHVYCIFLPEAMPAIVAGGVSLMINLVGFSAMAGTVGGGGLGDLAIRYGYQRYDLVLMGVIVIILVGLVQVIQSFGNWLCRWLYKSTS